MSESTFERKARKIRLIVTDVDGTLTDGGIYLGAEGFELKKFSVRDGLGAHLWREAGFFLCFLTGRPESGPVARRAEEMGVFRVKYGVREKGEGLRELCASLGTPLDETAYLGDDVMDLPVAGLAGLTAAPSDAAPEFRAAADLVLSARGGEGALRELVERLLRAKGLWEKLLQQRFGGSGR